MNKDMMWSYLIHLSTNMWADPKSCEKFNVYHPTLITEDDVWKKVIDFLPGHGFNTVLIDLGDAVQYESHPEIAIPGAWSKDKLKTELNRIRALGLTPIPKLNFSAAHDAWLGEYSHMVSTQPYYQVCADLIREVCELFDHPAYFHLGMDEENAESQKTYRFCCVRQNKLWWNDLFFLFNECEKNGTRPWIWADKCWNNTEEFITKMPKSALLSNWFYGDVIKNPDGTYAEKECSAYIWLNDAGFDQIPTSSTWGWGETWGRIFNPCETMELGRERLSTELLKGYLTAPWMLTEQSSINALFNTAQRFSFAKKEVYPEY